eukprot:760452-Hanusia_phi.AAC.3
MKRYQKYPYFWDFKHPLPLDFIQSGNLAVVMGKARAGEEREGQDKNRRGEGVCRVDQEHEVR